jgi:hypothetical protein
MLRISRKYLLLLLIFGFSFGYRMMFMHWEVYPSGADIGLHESVIYSITGSGNTNFLWNHYQMGGGLSLTFPGYHIFVSYIIMMTGMPDYLAHSTVVSFFSSFVVLCAYLIVRVFQGEGAALTVAFLAAISRFDIEMLLWGGFPNVITLMLIPLAFYLFLQRGRFSLFPFLAATTILSGAIFLTHSLSAVIFVLTTILTAMLIAIFSKRAGVPRTHSLVWVLPLFLGALVVSPFLVDAAPAYLSANAGAFTGAMVDIRQALLSTRVLPLEFVLPLFICIPFFFLFSKKYKDRFFSMPSLLLAVWMLVPLLFTQAHLVRLYTDYNRFLYYVILPLIILIALGIDHGSGFFARVVDTYLSLTKRTSNIARKSKYTAWLMPRLSREILYASFSVVLLVLAFFAVPIFLTPFQGVTIQSFYQVMNSPEYEAIQWARENTATGSVFVSDALYGWWFSGFAQRPVLSAVDPQYITLARELEPAKTAKNLLDTDYMIDNGLIQIREDGGYIGRHNPMFLAKLNWTYFPYAFFHFNNSEATVKVRIGDSVQSVDVSELAVRQMWVEKDNEHATISVVRGNSFLNYTQQTVVYNGVRFVNMSITVESNVEGVYLDWATFIVNIKGEVIPGTNTIGLLDEGVKVLGQFIFNKKEPMVQVVTSENPSGLLLDYNLQGKSRENIQLLVGILSVTDKLVVYQSKEVKNDYMNRILQENLNASYHSDFLKPSEDEDDYMDVFNYREAVKDWNIAYIACRDSELSAKFVNDPSFSLVFINDYVAIFAVKERLSGAK